MLVLDEDDSIDDDRIAAMTVRSKYLLSIGCFMVKFIDTIREGDGSRLTLPMPFWSD